MDPASGIGVPCREGVTPAHLQASRIHGVLEATRQGDADYLVERERTELVEVGVDHVNWPIHVLGYDTYAVDGVTRSY